MALIWQIAFRYLRGKRSANAVPILSRISMVAIAVSSCAMVIVFSVFNGLAYIVKDNYKAFYPDLKISVVKGKFFKMDSAKINAIKRLNGIRHITCTIEDNVFANNRDQQKVIWLKGIENSYFDVNDVGKYIVDGVDTVSTGHPYTAIAGADVLDELGADIHSLAYIELFYPNPNVTNPEADPLSAYQSLKLHPAGAFRVLEEFDSRYVLAPLPLVQELFQQKGSYSSIEISADQGAINTLKEQIKQMLGNAFLVETRFEQNKTLYMVFTGEKWTIFFILVLVLLISAFNMVGALSMLVLEKQKDIAILRAMGALPGTIRKIFLLEGMLWSLVGGLAGILLGCGICLAQQKFKLIKLGSNGFLVDAFPVRVELPDIALVIATIMAVGFIVSWYPAIRATKAVDPTLKST